MLLVLGPMLVDKKTTYNGLFLLFLVWHQNPDPNNLKPWGSVSTTHPASSDAGADIQRRPGEVRFHEDVGIREAAGRCQRQPLSP